MTIVRAFLAIAACKHWELHQIDIHNPFLHGDLDVEVYTKLPRGFDCPNPKMVCCLRKSLYAWLEVGSSLLVCQTSLCLEKLRFPAILF